MTLAVAALAATNASAQDKNLSTLQRMGNTATNMNIPVVPQEGKNADAIRANLKKVKLPDGFKIDLYAVVPDARYMA
ncbi:MAG: sorbosone dehydrogenase, partial [Limnohabitans sp.]